MIMLMNNLINFLPNYFGIRKLNMRFMPHCSLKLRLTFPCEMGQMIPTVLVTMRIKRHKHVLHICSSWHTAATIPPTSFNDKFIIFKLPVSIKK